MLSQFFVRLSQNERTALYELAARERRDIRDQAAVLIVEGLLQRGLIENVSADAVKRVGPGELSLAGAVLVGESQC